MRADARITAIEVPRQRCITERLPQQVMGLISVCRSQKSMPRQEIACAELMTAENE